MNSQTSVELTGLKICTLDFAALRALDMYGMLYYSKQTLLVSLHQIFKEQAEAFFNMFGGVDLYLPDLDDEARLSNSHVPEIGAYFGRQVVEDLYVRFGARATVRVPLAETVSTGSSPTSPSTPTCGRRRRRSAASSPASSPSSMGCRSRRSTRPTTRLRVTPVADEESLVPLGDADDENAIRPRDFLPQESPLAEEGAGGPPLPRRFSSGRQPSGRRGEGDSQRHPRRERQPPAGTSTHGMARARAEENIILGQDFVDRVMDILSTKIDERSTIQDLVSVGGLILNKEKANTALILETSKVPDPTKLDKPGEVILDRLRMVGLVDIPTTSERKKAQSVLDKLIREAQKRAIKSDGTRQ